MKNYLCKLSMTAALISSFTFSAPLFALEDGVVKGSYINLRAEPKFNSKIVGKKVRGDSYKVKFEQQNWVKKCVPLTCSNLTYQMGGKI